VSKSHPVTIGMDGYALAGTLLLPAHAAADNPVPGVVIAGGPDPLPQIRVHEQGGANWPLLWAHALAKAGYAVLCYDQRGGGLSTGVYHEATRDDLYQDLLNVVDMLRAQPEVDSQRIAVVAWAEGAGFGLQLAHQGVVNAAVLLAPPFHTAEERYTRWIRALAARKGLSERVVNLRVQMWRQDMAATVERVNQGVRTTTTELGGKQVTTNLVRFVQNQQFDPKSLLPGLSSKLLLLHGAADNVIPAAESAELKATLDAAGVPVARIEYPGVEHFIYREQRAIRDAAAWLQTALAPVN
jgi:pimeloyl-ACP methyl ester carboxylesterase